MQAFRRLYATIPDAAAAARTASTPQAVRLRRLKKGITAEPGTSDATPEGLTPSEASRYTRLRAMGDLTNEDGSELSEEQWLKKLNARRSRVRGERSVKREDGTVQIEVVANKIYLPNIVFRLVRNNTPPGQAYNPYEATFRVPPSITKTDIRSYLSAVYGVKTTYIRTDLYFPPVPKPHHFSPRKKAYKRAATPSSFPFLVLVFHC